MKKALWSFFEIIETVAIAVTAVVLVRSFVAQPFLVSGSSMEPSFYNGNYLLVDEFTYRFRAPERGEVIVFKYPGDLRSYYIKRIIGLPGEKVVVDKGKVSVYTPDGKEIDLKEPYTSQFVSTAHFETIVQKGEYFVMGDNRNFSFDSRSWGPLPAKDVIGLVRLRLWPPTEVSAFSAPQY